LIIGACVIDPDYEGEVHIHMWNVSNIPVWIEPGDKIMQLVPLPLHHMALIEASFKKRKIRGEGGFGST
jgi:dUTP pyrophosphatase